jgi:hypothetical protein
MSKNNIRINQRRNDDRVNKKLTKILSSLYEVTPGDEEYYSAQTYLEQI